MKRIAVMGLFTVVFVCCANMKSSNKVFDTDDVPEDTSPNALMPVDGTRSEAPSFITDDRYGSGSLASHNSVTIIPEPDTTTVERSYKRAKIEASFKEELKADLHPLLSRSTSELPVRKLSSGQLLIGLQRGFGHATLAKKMPNGKIKITCVNNIKAADKWFWGDNLQGREE